MTNIEWGVANKRVRAVNSHSLLSPLTLLSYELASMREKCLLEVKTEKQAAFCTIGGKGPLG